MPTSTPTLTPTAATGATSTPLAMVSVPDVRLHVPGAFETALDDAGLNGVFVADQLSAFLTHERCGAHLYRTAAGLTNNPVLARRYTSFGEETVEHARILEDLVSAHGGDPQYVSPSARAVEKMDMAIHQSTFLATGSIDVLTAEVVLLDAVILAETRDHANWQLLAQLAEVTSPGPLRDDLERAVTTVLEQEDEHLIWAQTTWQRLMERQSRSSGMTSLTAGAEAAVASIKEWFSDEAPGGHTS